jgi:hypothetical protein
MAADRHRKRASKRSKKKASKRSKKQGRETFLSKDGSLFVEKKPGPKDVGPMGPGMFFHVKIRDPSKAGPYRGPKSKLKKGSGKWEKKK